MTMELAKLVTYALTFGGVIILVLSLFPARRMNVEGRELSRSWVTIILLIVVFIVGYVAYGFTMIGRLTDGTSEVIVAGLLFGGSCFVYVTCLVSEAGLRELRRIAALERHRASHDELTGLPNRGSFVDHIKTAIRERDSAYGQTFAVLIMDMDGFKTVNDTVGHSYGDLLLQDVSTRLRRVLKNRDVLARMGGDEFGALIYQGDEPDKLEAITQRLISALDRPFVLEGQLARVAMTVGAAIYPGHGRQANDLVKNAEIAMYEGKRITTPVVMYDNAFDRNDVRRLSLLSELGEALNGEGLVAHYQPVMDLRSGGIAGVEALLRWSHPVHGMLMPEEFVPLAEQHGLMQKLDRWVLECVFDQLAKWQAQGVGVPISANLSAVNLQDTDIVQFIFDGIRSRSLAPGQLKLEITENAVMSDPAKALEVIERLRRFEIQFSIDDFGTGYSTLVYLKNLPVQEIKIDRSFVMDMSKDNNDALIIRSTIELAHKMGHYVTAEGVESQNALDLLRLWGCDRVQGYHISHPLAIDELNEHLNEERFGREPLRQVG